MKTDETDPLPSGMGRDILNIPAPPISPQLATRLGTMKRVRTRSRWGSFLVVLMIGLIWPAFTLLRNPLRRDLLALPPVWVALGAALWATGFLASLGAALIPARGDVLPSAGRGSRAGSAAMGVLFLFTALWTASAPGVSLRPEDVGSTLLQSSLGCGRYVLQVAAVVVLLGALTLRRVLPMGGRRMGMALGAAGGALGGLALHFLCPFALTSHVLVGHVGAMILAAAAGALLLPALAGR